MISPREVTITAAVRSAFPKAKKAAVVSAIHAAAQSDVALAQIDKHLAAHPDALTSGHSSAPPPVIRLVKALQEIGLDAKAPTCGNCHRVMRLPYKVGEQRWCGTCYSHTTKVVCITCGKEKMIGARMPDGPVCGNCLRYSKAEECVGCGRVRPVAGRGGDGPRCQACVQRPAYVCSGCGERRPAHAMVDGQPVCRFCYRPPRRRCGLCGNVGAISVAATGGSPDICQRCYAAPLKPCPQCGLRVPCAHDAEYYDRPGNEGLEPMDADDLARTRRMSPRPLRRCARCLRDRPAQAVWPLGPVCSSCYDAVLRHPGACATCGTVSTLIGSLGDEAICGPCAGSDRTYTCQQCGTPTRAVANGTCARCYAQGEFDRILANASEDWQPLRQIPQETESPLALVTWLRRSRGARLLEDLIAAGRAPAHEDLKPGKAEHYLRSLLVEADILDARIEPLERLPEWVDTLVEGDPADIQQTLRRFAQWHVLRRARRRTARRTFTEGSGKWARQQVSVARAFLFWLADHDSTLEECRQPLIDLWLASGSTRRYVIRDFIAWARKDGLVPKNVRIPLRPVKIPTTPTAEEQRWALLASLLTSENIPDEIRVAGSLVLVYGQHLSRVVALKPSAVTIGTDTCHITVAGTALPLPLTMAEPLRRLTANTNRGKSSVTRRAAGDRWLFPGGNPGQHLTSEHLRSRLAEHGITLREARHAALLQWAQDTPGPILAAALGLHINTAVAWRDSIQADYTDYVAARAASLGPDGSQAEVHTRQEMLTSAPPRS